MTITPPRRNSPTPPHPTPHTPHPSPKGLSEISTTEPQSPANGQPITLLQTESPDIYPAEGIEQ